MTDYTFEQLVDINMIRRLLESHQRVSGMAYGLFDAAGNDIVSVGWQEICVSFHRAHPVTCVYCRESNTSINEHLHEATDSFGEYRCPNGMIHAAMAIIIDGAHLATFFIGQFFYNDALPDRKFFMSQAVRLGFDCDRYLAALDRVPTFSRDYVRDNMQFLRDMVQLMTGMGADSLKRFRETEARNKQHEYLSSLLDSALNQAADAVFLIDGNQRLVFVNEAACRSLGYCREELLHLTPPDFDPDLTPEMASAMLAELFTTGRQRPFESRHRTKSGRNFPVELSVAMFEHGGAQYSLCVVRDITERKRLEEQLRSAIHASEAANMTKSIFLANISHELRTPLNGVIGMAQLLETTMMTEKQNEYLECLQLSADSLLSLINDILNITCIEAEKLQIDCQQYSLRQCIDEVVGMQQARIAEKGLSFELQVSDAVPDCLTGDHVRIRQILSNLLSNAVKFTDQGGVTLTVRIKEQDDVRLLLDLAVADTGIGIEAEKQAYIFNLFTQADESFTRRHGGAGLGLPISQKLAELIGGCITVESEIKKGSTFHLLLPCTMPYSIDQVEMQPNEITTYPF